MEISDLTALVQVLVQAALAGLQKEVERNTRDIATLTLEMKAIAKEINLQQGADLKKRFESLVSRVGKNETLDAKQEAILQGLAELVKKDKLSADSVQQVFHLHGGKGGEAAGAQINQGQISNPKLEND